jgi:phosphoglycolate phosphatase
MKLSPRYPTVLFDLDGTLTDPFVGIARSVRYALERLDRPPIDDQTLRGWIGPSLRGSFATVLGGDMALAERAVALYRERYGPTGAFENTVYPGIPDLLADLAAAGCSLCLATSKPQIFAGHILEHFGLDRHFRVIGGASLDASRETKASVVAYVLGELPPYARDGAIMVGDREHDVIGARANELPAIGVSYGYGSEAELQDARPVAIAASVDELRGLLLAAGG